MIVGKYTKYERQKHKTLLPLLMNLVCLRAAITFYDFDIACFCVGYVANDVNSISSATICRKGS